MASTRSSVRDLDVFIVDLLSKDRNKKYAALKFYTKRQEECKEFETYKVLSGANTKHPGHRHIRPVYNKFKIARPGGHHWCLVQEPMCDSLGDFVKRTANHRLTTDLLRMTLIQILYALDYVHTECKLVHTGNSSCKS